MGASPRDRLLIVDDEEAILETMTFTFEDDYEVHTSTDPVKALDLLDRNGPFSVVITDQRMPDMTGVEFLAEVYRRHPQATRIILTGFADMEAIIKAINDGHVYAYITKPWEPEQLTQVVRRAVDHYKLAVENARLLADVQRANVFLRAVMDRLDTGALAVDAAGVVRAANRPAREYLGLEGDPQGRLLKEVLDGAGLSVVEAAARSVTEDEDSSYEEVEVASRGCPLRIRVGVHRLTDPEGGDLGRVILMREISHEPLRRRFEEILGGLDAEDADRSAYEATLEQVRELLGRVKASRVDSPGMAEVQERASRAITAISNWLDVDEALAQEEFPDAQLLRDRMRVALRRWPRRDSLPQRVRQLDRRVEAYYESGENTRQRTL